MYGDVTFSGVLFLPAHLNSAGVVILMYEGEEQNVIYISDIVAADTTENL